MAEQRTRQGLHLAHQLGQLRPSGRIPVAPALAQTRADVLDRRRLLRQVATPLIGDGVHLLAFLLRRGDVAKVLQHLQRRIHRAWAGAIEAARLLLEGANDVVAVARLILEQLQNDVLQVAATEEAFAPSEAAPTAATEAAERPVHGWLAVGPATAVMMTKKHVG